MTGGGSKRSFVWDGCQADLHSAEELQTRFSFTAQWNPKATVNLEGSSEQVKTLTGRELVALAALVGRR